MNKDYFFNMQMQPVLDAILDSLNVTNNSLITPLYLQYVGLAFNTSELCLNANPNVWFVNLISYIYNFEGANKSIVFIYTGGSTMSHSTSIGSGLSNFSITLLPFNYMRITAAGGLVANASTTITFIGYRIQI
jgi:hypothetical protein